MRLVLLLMGVLLTAFWCYHLVGEHRHKPLRSFFFPALALKLFCTVTLGWLYQTYFDGGDTWMYAEISQEITALAFEDPEAYWEILTTQPVSDRSNLLYVTTYRTLYFVNFLSLVNLFTYSNYWFTSLLLSLFAFQMAWILANKLDLFLDEWAVAAAFLFFPSVVFWSSGMLKETIAFGLICWIVSLALPFVTQTGPLKVKHLLLMLLAGYLLFQLKYYYAVALGAFLIPGLLTNWISQKIGLLTSFRNQLILWFALLLLCGFLASLSHYNLHLQHLLTVVVENHDEIVRVSDPERTIQYRELEPNLVSILLNAPVALFAGLFRPGIWEVKDWLTLFVGFENLLLLVFVLQRVLSFRNYNWRSLTLWAVLGYVVFLATLLALSTPNLGTLTRFKVSYLPFLVLFLFDRQPWIRSIVYRFRPSQKDLSNGD